MIDDAKTPLERIRAQLDAITTEAHTLSVRREYLEARLNRTLTPTPLIYSFVGYLLLLFVLCLALAIFGLLLAFAQTVWFALLIILPVCFGLSVIFVYGGLRGLHQEELRAIGPRYQQLEQQYRFYTKMAALLAQYDDEPDTLVGSNPRIPGADAAA